MLLADEVYQENILTKPFEVVRVLFRGLCTRMQALRRVLGAAAPKRISGFHVLTEKTVNPRVVDAQYAVRGELVIRAEEIRKKLDKGEKLPFDKLIMCNIGNPQSLKQKPLTFVRQVCFFV